MRWVVRSVAEFKAMDTATYTFDTAHNGPVNDVQMDYYGKRLATASSDHSVRVWDVTRDVPAVIAKLEGHESPVWQVSWSHPKFGSLLASCSFDRRVIIWKEQHGSFTPAYVHQIHESSVNSISFAPVEFGLHLACGSSDGSVSVISFNPSTASWTSKSFQAHPAGVNAVSWAPAAAAGHKSEYAIADMRLVTGGCDNAVRFWSCASGEFVEEPLGETKVHDAWVRDVAFRPTGSVATAASACEKGLIAIWTFDGQKWVVSQRVTPVDAAAHGGVWRLSWSATGSILAVAIDDSNVIMYRENLEGKYERTVQAL